MNLSKPIAMFCALLFLGVIAVAQSDNSDAVPVVSAVAPMYPSIARTANATGDVTTKVAINRVGKVTSVESKGGHPLFRKVADEAARRWLFAPSLTDTKRTATLTFSFRLVESDAPAYEATSVYYPPYKIEARAMKPVVTTTRGTPTIRWTRAAGACFAS